MVESTDSFFAFLWVDLNLFSYLCVIINEKG